MEDILAIDDIKLLVNSFYSKVREDALLSDIFNDRIGNKWPEHLEKMYRFWQTVLLEKQTYTGSPFPPHAKLPVSKEHFDRWLFLFNETIDEHFSGEKAKEAKWRADKMAELFLYKIDYFKNNPKRIL
ncbi:MAG TPA: group III truncated hemoglobin [Bacteroidia bacterium]|jgi:hemoglobin|nr:group III truncated hemoglobin [Bacteroidia bacterium]